MKLSREAVYKLLVLAEVILLQGCRIGGVVTATPSTYYVGPASTPSNQTPFTGSATTRTSPVTIGGFCTTGNQISLSVDSTAVQTCVNSYFTFNVSKSNDGVYSFLISETDSSNKIISSKPFVWILKSSIAQPSFTSPPSISYASAETTLRIRGICESGASVQLTGTGSGSPDPITCTNGSFAFDVNQGSNGNYSFTVTQTDSVGNAGSNTLTWNKQPLASNLSVATVSAPASLKVKLPQNFTFSGGSGIFNHLTVLQNHSLGTLDSSQNIYTPGSLAGEVDILQVTDSLNETLDIYIKTIPDIADHLKIQNPLLTNNQIQTVGGLLSNNLLVQVVDQYENPVPGTPVTFVVNNGDAQIVVDPTPSPTPSATPGFLSKPIQVSDSNGQVQVKLLMGYSAVTNSITAKSPSLLGTRGPNSVTFFASSTSLPIPSPVPSPTPTARSAANFSNFTLNTLRFPTPNNPNELVVADFNTDGKPDYALISGSSGGSITVFLGQGKGQFAQLGSAIATCSSPKAIRAGKFKTSGGSIDLAVVCSGSNQIDILSGDGQGHFTHLRYLSTGTTPLDLAVADFDHDGNLDIAAVSSISLGGALDNGVDLYFGSGNRTFSTPANSIPTGIQPNSIAVADLNYTISPSPNVYPDLLVTNGGDTGGNGLTVLVNSRNGSQDPNLTFQTAAPYTTGSSPGSVASGDFNKDGFNDVVVTNFADNTLTLFQGSGNGTLSAASFSTLNTGANPGSISMLDMTGDGNIDLVFSNYGESNFGIISGDGTGSFNIMATYPTGISPIAIHPLDANEDSIKDILAISTQDQSVQVILGSGNGNFKLNIPTATNPAQVALGDFNRDGKQDMVFSNSGSNSLSIRLGGGTGVFQAMSPISTGAGTVPTGLITSDFNQDGYADIAVINSGKSSVGIYLSDGNGSFHMAGPANSLLLGDNVATQPTAIVAGDFKEDGIPDIAVTNAANSTVSILIGNGDGTFQSKTNYNTGRSPSNVIIGDFNRDGHLDLAVTNATDSSVSILLGNGDGTFQSKYDISVGNNPTALVAGDFFGHGNAILDLAVVNYSDNTITILKGLGDGSFTKPNTDLDLFGTPSGLLTGDFNGDGILDLAVSNGSNLGFSIFLGNGTPKSGTTLGRGDGNFNAGNQIPLDSSTAISLTAMTLGDLNQDGILDIVAIGNNDTLVQVWLGY